jgi:hypothetical protein
MKYDNFISNCKVFNPEFLKNYPDKYVLNAAIEEFYDQKNQAENKKKNTSSESPSSTTSPEEADGEQGTNSPAPAQNETSEDVSDDELYTQLDDLLKKWKKTKKKDLKFYVNGKEDKDEITGYDHDINIRIDNPRKDSLNPFLEFIISVGLSEKFEDAGFIGSVNGLETPAGLHIKMVNKAYTNAFEAIFGDVSGYACKGVNFLVILQCNEPSFSSQTKEKLSDIREFDLTRLPDLEKAFKRVINDNLEYYKQNFDRITEYLHSIDKLGKLGEIRKNVLIASQNSRLGSYQPKKLKECTTTEREKAELFIVEGDSAAGSLLPYRDLKYHAILP